MRFVEDDRVVVGDCGAAVRATQREIGKEQVMVDHHDARGLGLAFHAGDEARVEVRAILTDPSFARRAHLAPDRLVLGQSDEVGDIARFGGGRPFFDDGEHTRCVWIGGLGARAVLTESAQTKVVGQALHQGRIDTQAERLANERDVLVEDLLLQSTGSGRDDDLLAAQNCRHEVSEGLARSGAGFANQHAIAGEGALDRVGHCELTGPVLVAPSDREEALRAPGFPVVPGARIAEADLAKMPRRSPPDMTNFARRRRHRSVDGCAEQGQMIDATWPRTSTDRCTTSAWAAPGR